MKSCLFSTMALPRLLPSSIILWHIKQQSMQRGGSSSMVINATHRHPPPLLLSKIIQIPCESGQDLHTHRACKWREKCFQKNKKIWSQPWHINIRRAWTSRVHYFRGVHSSGGAQIIDHVRLVLSEMRRCAPELWCTVCSFPLYNLPWLIKDRVESSLLAVYGIYRSCSFGWLFNRWWNQL